MQDKNFELLVQVVAHSKGSVLIPCRRPDLKALSSYKRFIKNTPEYFEHSLPILPALYIVCMYVMALSNNRQ